MSDARYAKPSKPSARPRPGAVAAAALVALAYGALWVPLKIHSPDDDWEMLIAPHLAFGLLVVWLLDHSFQLPHSTKRQATMALAWILALLWLVSGIYGLFLIGFVLSGAMA